MFPRFQGENFEKNIALVHRIEELAKPHRVTPSQLALAWVLARGDDIVPIPGTKRRSYLEQNAGSAAIELSREELERIETAAPKGVAVGTRYADMRSVNR